MVLALTSSVDWRLALAYPSRKNPLTEPEIATVPGVLARATLVGRLLFVELKLNAAGFNE